MSYDRRQFIHVPVLVHGFGSKGPETKENSAYPVFPQGHIVSWLYQGVSRSKEIKLRLEHAQMIIINL